jgi:hypothetical protein
MKVLAVLSLAVSQQFWVIVAERKKVNYVLTV